MLDDPVAFISTPDQTGAPAWMGKLSATDAKAFGKFTGDNIGEVIEIYVCETLMSAPVIQSVIPGGRFMITGEDAVLNMPTLLKNGCPA